MAPEVGGSIEDLSPSTRPMDFELTEEQRAFADAVSRFAKATLSDGALARAEDGELFLEYRQSEALSYDDGRLKSASFDTMQGFGLRAVSGEATGYAHASELSEAALRRAATMAAVPCITTLTGASAAVNGIRALRSHVLAVRSLQDYYRAAKSKAQA